MIGRHGRRCSPLAAIAVVAFVTVVTVGCYVGVEPEDSAGVSDGLTTSGTGDASTSTSSTSTSTSSTSTSTSSTSTSTSSTSTSTSTSTSDASTGVDTSVDSTGDTDGTSSTSDATTGPMGAYCDDADAWDQAYAALEDEVLVIVNQRRAEGASCGAEGSFAATGPLTMNPLLRCAARYHSEDMVVRDFFSHTNPDGETPWDRLEKTGYGAYATAGENIAAGSASAAGVMNQWMTSDGHCANIMNPEFKELGVGYFPGGPYGHVWTQVFATQ